MCNLLTIREFASRVRKSRARWVHVDTQYVVLVSHVCAVTTKGDSPLEEISIIGRCGNRSKSNAVARSWIIDNIGILSMVGRSLPLFGRLMGSELRVL